MVYRFADDPDRNINVFLRPMVTPLQDRNLISFSLNAGLTMHEPFFGRDDDTFGVGMGFARVSNGASGLDSETAFYNPGVYSPARTNETFVEATYQYRGHAVVADSAGRSICLQSGRRSRQSEQSDAEDQERSGARRAHQHHLLNAAQRRLTR